MVSLQIFYNVLFSLLGALRDFCRLALQSAVCIHDDPGHTRQCGRKGFWDPFARNYHSDVTCIFNTVRHGSNALVRSRALCEIGSMFSTC